LLSRRGGSGGGGGQLKGGGSEPVAAGGASAVTFEKEKEQWLESLTASFRRADSGSSGMLPSSVGTYFLCIVRVSCLSFTIIRQLLLHNPTPNVQHHHHDHHHQPNLTHQCSRVFEAALLAPQKKTYWTSSVTGSSREGKSCT
jgi:hypothetical protein